MKLHTEKRTNLSWFKFINLSKYNSLVHFVSTRSGGLSCAPYNSLNLGFKVNDDLSAVIQNRIALADAVGINAKNFVIPSQCHSSNILIATQQHKGRGFYEKDDAIIDTDAIVTAEKELCLLVFSADCVPILLFDPVNAIIAAAHAGWKGTVNQIVSKVIETMTTNFKTNPADVVAGVGPSIGPCCYNIGEEVITIVKEKYGANTTLLQRNTKNNKLYFNLWEANVTNLIQSGVQEKNIEVSALCTSCRSDLFFSHRNSGGLTGRFGAGIMLK